MRRIPLLTLVLALLSTRAHAAPFAYVTSTLDNTVVVIDTATDKVTAVVPVGILPYGSAVAPDGSRAYIVNDTSNTVSVISTPTNAVIATVPVGNNPFGVAVHPSGTPVYVVNRGDSVSGSISVLDAGSATVIGTIPVQAQPRMVAFDPSGTRAYVTNRKSGTVSVIDTASSTVIATITVGTTPYDIDVDPSGARVYNTNTGDGTVSVIDTNTLGVIATVPVLNEPRCLAVHPNGRSLWVVNRGSYSVSIIDTTTLRVVTTTPVGPLPIGIAFTPDGARAYVTISGLMTKAGDPTGAVAVLDGTTAQVKNKIIAGISPRTYGKFIGPATIVEPTATPEPVGGGTPTTATTPTPTVSPSPPGLCAAAPQLECRLPTGTQHATLRMTESTRSDRDLILWKWIGGEATPTQAFGDPAASDGYALCLYGEASGVPKLLLSARVPAGTLCGAHSCWKTSRTGFRYTDSTRAVGGLSSIVLQAGREGAARVLVSGAGSGLKLPLLPLATPVRIQLQNTIGDCWETRFLASDVAVHGSGSNGTVWKQGFRNFETPD